MQLLIATNNVHKFEELKPLFAGHELLRPADLGIQHFNPEECGETFFENALIKAESLYNITERPVIADDSGLCVEELGGRPGIESARYGSLDGTPLSAEEKTSSFLRSSSMYRTVAVPLSAVWCCITVGSAFSASRRPWKEK